MGEVRCQLHAYHDKCDSMFCIHHFPLDLGLPLLEVSCTDQGENPS